MQICKEYHTSAVKDLISDMDFQKVFSMYFLHSMVSFSVSVYYVMLYFRFLFNSMVQFHSQIRLRLSLFRFQPLNENLMQLPSRCNLSMKVLCKFCQVYNVTRQRFLRYSCQVQFHFTFYQQIYYFDQNYDSILSDVSGFSQPH